MNYYDAIANGYNELYSEEQEKKYEFIENRIPKAKLILDLGAGTGIISKKLEKFGKVIALDNSIRMIEKYDGIKIIADALNLPFKDKSFNLVFSLTMLQDIKDKNRVIFEMERVGKKIIFSVLKKTFSMKLEKYEKLEEERDYFFIK